MSNHSLIERLEAKKKEYNSFLNPHHVVDDCIAIIRAHQAEPPHGDALQKVKSILQKYYPDEAGRLYEIFTGYMLNVFLKTEKGQQPDNSIEARIAWGKEHSKQLMGDATAYDNAGSKDNLADGAPSSSTKQEAHQPGEYVKGCNCYWHTTGIYDTGKFMCGQAEAAITVMGEVQTKPDVVRPASSTNSTQTLIEALNALEDAIECKQPETIEELEKYLPIIREALQQCEIRVIEPHIDPAAVRLMADDNSVVLASLARELRRYHNFCEALPKREAVNRKLVDALKLQHQWHLNRGTETIEGVIIDMADAYCDSSMYEKTIDALNDIEGQNT